MSSPPAPTRADVDAFTTALDEFVRALGTVRGRFNRAPAVPELSVSQLHLLEPLAEEGRSVPVCTLAEACGISAPTATRMLDGLVTRGIAERTRSEHGDRRRVEVTLTDHGRGLVAVKRARVKETREALFARLSPAERDSAARLLHSLAAAMEDLNP